VSTVPRRKYTFQEYFEREEASSTRHEFYRGEIFAMSGGSLEHWMIGENISRTLFALVRNRGCRPHGSSQRIFTPGVELHTYPDVSVVCGDPQMSEIDPYAITNPLAIVEVLSPSTDTGARLRVGAARRLPGYEVCLSRGGRSRT
jgi:Uma2 family endonuclease